MGIKQFNHAALIDFTNCIAPDEQACILHGSRCHQCMTVCLNPKMMILSGNERMIYLSSTWVDAGLSASSTFFNAKFWNALRHGSRHASHFFNVFNELYKKKKTQVWTEWLHDERLQHYCIYLCGWRLPHKNCTRHQGCKKVCICSSISSLSWLNCGWIINSSLKQYSDYFRWKPSLLPLCPLDKPSELCYRRHPWEPPSCASPPRDRLL